MSTATSDHKAARINWLREFVRKKTGKRIVFSTAQVAIGELERLDREFARDDRGDDRARRDEALRHLDAIADVLRG